MAINTEELIFEARAMLTELPESVTLSRDNLFDMIRPAIQLWQEKTNADIGKRQNFIKQSTDINIVDGFADISTVVDSLGYRLDFLHESDIYVPYAGEVNANYTVKFVNSLNRLMSIGRQDKFFVLAFLSGSSITFKEPGEVGFGSMNGTFQIRSVVIPTDLTQMPASVMPEIAVILADLAAKQIKQQNRGLDRTPK
jgi:hypothetical protein